MNIIAGSRSVGVEASFLHVGYLSACCACSLQPEVRTLESLEQTWQVPPDSHVATLSVSDALELAEDIREAVAKRGQQETASGLMARMTGSDDGVE